MGASAAAMTARRAAYASASTLLPCINQVTTLGAAFDAECSAYHGAGFRHVELWFPKLKQLGLAPPAIAARLREAALTPVSACAAGNLLWRGAPGPVERRGELEAHFALAEALGVPLRTALQVIRRAAQGNVGLCLDTFHFYAGVSKLEDLDELRPGEVEHVHFHDVPGAVPRELLVDADRIPPGTGVIPLRKVVDALRRIGYAGALSVELFDPVVQKSDPNLTARTCYAAVTRFTSAP